MADWDPSDYRTEPDEVSGGGFETDLGTEEIWPHIDDANMFVDEQLAGEGMTDRRLAKIERALARHSIRFVAERQVDSESIGSVSFQYSGAFDAEGLEATAPGQKAIEYDTSGTLGNDPPATFEVF